jgi:steroid 5-alpha reductase family enzyme
MLLTAAVVIFVYVNLVHLLALLKKDNGIMDGAWGLGFILVTLFTLGAADGLDARRILLGVLVLVWGARLSLHILIRNAGRAGEDFRYRNWRETWGRWFYVRMLLKVSGIPMLEAKYKDKPEYQEYQRTTSAFFPWLPRKP